jgi:exosortase
LTPSPNSRPQLLFLLLLLGSVLLLFPQVRSLLALSSSDDSFSHLPIIPAISAFLVFSERQRAGDVRSGTDFRGIAAILPGVGLALYLRSTAGLSVEIANALTGLALVLIWTGSFGFCFGVDTLRKSPFPFLFLLFMVPLPPVVLDPVIGALQRASSELVNVFFRLTGVTYMRESVFVYTLPGLSIEVAKQCSGIRSSMSLFIVGVLAGHMVLRSGWRKGVLALSVFPITVFKNSIRIVLLTLLSVYVDEGFMKGNLHRVGGIPFFVGALLLLGGVLWILRRSEGNKPTVLNP